jgi:hypothetical protein
MNKLIDDAVEVLRELPEDVQAAAARAIIDYGAGYDDDVERGPMGGLPLCSSRPTD